MLIPESIESCLKGVTNIQRSRRIDNNSLMELALAVRSLCKSVQLNLDPRDLDTILDICESALDVAFSADDKRGLSTWCLQTIEANSSRVNDIICLVSIRLRLSPTHIKYCLQYLLRYSTSTWDRLCDDIKSQVQNDAVVSGVEQVFDKCDTSSRIRVYELGIPSLCIWNQFTEDLSKYEEEDVLMHATCLQALYDACIKNSDLMINTLRFTNIFSYLRDKVSPDNMRILQLLASLPGALVNYANNEQNEIMSQMLNWFEDGKISATVCFEMLAASSQRFPCSDKLQQSLSMAIKCSPTSERIPAILATSLVVHTWPFKLCQSVCQKIFQMSMEPFLDHRLACHKFYENIAKSNFTLLLECVPAFLEYLFNSTTEHEIEGLQSKWSLIERISTCSDNADVKNILMKGFSIYSAGLSNSNSLQETSIPKVAEETM
ncbi:hypothetical protein GJ496_010143 [Pomphorhynchus laevis]|nr:hypothetical protein GJ496_010143 [Pomphorhynchus laevis]